MEIIINTSLQDLIDFFINNRMLITGFLAVTLVTSIYLKDILYKVK